MPSDESRKQSDNKIYREETIVVIESDSDSQIFLFFSISIKKNLEEVKVRYT